LVASIIAKTPALATAGSDGQALMIFVISGERRAQERLCDLLGTNVGTSTGA
jgi:hypothetical protein